MVHTSVIVDSFVGGAQLLPDKRAKEILTKSRPPGNSARADQSSAMLMAALGQLRTASSTFGRSSSPGFSSRM